MILKDCMLHKYKYIFILQNIYLYLLLNYIKLYFIVYNNTQRI